MNWIPVLAPAIFYVFAAALILTPLILRHRDKLAARRMIADVLASGKTIDPEVVERLVPPPKPADPRGVAFWFCVPGISLTAIAIGLAIAGTLYPDPKDMAREIPAAIVFGSMGVGFLLIASIAFALFKPPPRA